MRGRRSWNRWQARVVRRTFVLAIGLLSITAAACRPKPDDIAGPEKPWEEMSYEARQAYMASQVLPYMKKRFQEHDPERFADFGCPTCHGSGAETGTYEMPNPELPVLDRKNFREEHQKKHPEMVQFMWEHVEIEVATLLGKRTGRGSFNCRSCHTTK